MIVLITSEKGIFNKSSIGFLSIGDILRILVMLSFLGHIPKSNKHIIFRLSFKL
jgi:hypothetical protein